MAGLLPTAAPPNWMIFSMCSSEACFCQTVAWKLRGCGVSDAEAGPSPRPSGPWQGVQRREKICLASALAPALSPAAEAAPGDAEGDGAGPWALPPFEQAART